ncbi:MAG: hypothetical protein SFW65_09040 [Alphaproteobacteria bacterium]|nr:hypothetical protein [Alphaproteobacteria bacterium]
MVKAKVLSLVLACGVCITIAGPAFAQAQPAADVKQEQLTTIKDEKVPEPVVVLKQDPSEDPPKVTRKMRKMGMGTNGGDRTGGAAQALQQSIFAFPGTKCPAGSSIYKGPETKMAAADNAVYCVFTKEVIVLPKSARECKGRLKPYKDDSVKPDDDVIWCKKSMDFLKDAAVKSGGKFEEKKDNRR